MPRGVVQTSRRGCLGSPAFQPGPTSWRGWGGPLWLTGDGIRSDLFLARLTTLVVPLVGCPSPVGGQPASRATHTRSRPAAATRAARARACVTFRHNPK